MFLGKRTYGELLDSPGRIPTNILADRQKRLEDAGIIASAAYQQRPVRYAYTLTERGRALGDVLLAFVRWVDQVRQPRLDVDLRGLDAGMAEQVLDLLERNPCAVHVRCGLPFEIVEAKVLQTAFLHGIAEYSSTRPYAPMVAGPTLPVNC